MKAPRFEIFKSDKDGNYYFRLKAKNGRIILASEGYTAKHNCKNGVNAVIETIEDLPIPDFEMKWAWEQLPNGKKRMNKWFVLKAANGEIIGTSEMYRSKRGCLGGIESCRKNAPIAEIVDLTKD